MPALGLLGLGYMGEKLIKSNEWSCDSWVSTHKPNSPSKYLDRYQSIHFEWENRNTWSNIPELELPLVITIPPVFKEPEKEKHRLIGWCKWMCVNRNQISRIVYISTTGVYPNEASNWTEAVTTTPDTDKGQLRLISEQILSKYFDTKILRVGAIYGPDRHLGTRIQGGKIIPKGGQLIHRIHVSDLVDITVLAVDDRDFPKVVNVVDTDNSPSEKVARWIVANNFYSQSPPLNLQEGYYTRKKLNQNPKRIISNNLLVKKIGYKFKFPTYKEGLKQAINES